MLGTPPLLCRITWFHQSCLALLVELTTLKRRFKLEAKVRHHSAACDQSKSGSVLHHWQEHLSIRMQRLGFSNLTNDNWLAVALHVLEDKAYDLEAKAEKQDTRLTAALRHAAACVIPFDQSQQTLRRHSKICRSCRVTLPL